MRKLFIIPLVLLLCFTFGCQQAEEVAEEPMVDIAAEQAAIQEAFSSWTEANDAKDIDGLASFFTEDSDSFVGSQLRDITYLKEFWSDTFSKGNYWTAHPPEKIVVSDIGDMAYLIFSAQFTRLVEGEPNTSDKYSLLMVWKKQADGSWKIVAFK